MAGVLTSMVKAAPLAAQRVLLVRELRDGHTWPQRQRHAHEVIAQRLHTHAWNTVRPRAGAR